MQALLRRRCRCSHINSIGYVARDSRYDKDGNRILTDIALHEVSLVSLPANPRAQLTPSKSADPTTAIIDALAKLRAVAVQEGSNVIQFPRASDSKQIEDQIADRLGALAAQISAQTLNMKQMPARHTSENVGYA